MYNFINTTKENVVLDILEDKDHDDGWLKAVGKAEKHLKNEGDTVVLREMTERKKWLVVMQEDGSESRYIGGF
jgi:hypothetical protein